MRGQLAEMITFETPLYAFIFPSSPLLLHSPTGRFPICLPLIALTFLEVWGNHQPLPALPLPWRIGFRKSQRGSVNTFFSSTFLIFSQLPILSVIPQQSPFPLRVWAQLASFPSSIGVCLGDWHARKGVPMIWRGSYTKLNLCSLLAKAHPSLFLVFSSSK